MEIVEWHGDLGSGEAIRVYRDPKDYDLRILKQTLDECKKKLNVDSDNKVYRHISLDGTFHPPYLSRKKLEKDPRNLIRILREQILTVSKPKRYPGNNIRKNSKQRALSGEVIKRRVLKKLESGDVEGLKKLCQSMKPPLDRVKKDLRRAILDEDYCLDLMKKYLSLLPPPADF